MRGSFFSKAIVCVLEELHRYPVQRTLKQDCLIEILSKRLELDPRPLPFFSLLVLFDTCNPESSNFIIIQYFRSPAIVQCLPYIVIQEVPLVDIQDNSTQLILLHAKRFIGDSTWSVYLTFYVPILSCRQDRRHGTSHSYLKYVLKLHLLMRCQQKPEENEDLPPV